MSAAIQAETDRPAPLKPRMTAGELGLFQSFTRHAQNYLEFGAGGSTCIAAASVGRSILSVDSSKDWLDKVGTLCAAYPEWVQPRLVHADIGPLKAWGAPADDSTRDRWPGYYEDIWRRPEAAQADLYMVDGRFRIACFMQILLHCQDDALIAMHDFRLRDSYAVILEVAREVASVETMSVFMKRRNQDENRIRAILKHRRFHYI